MCVYTQPNHTKFWDALASVVDGSYDGEYDMSIIIVPSYLGY